MEKAEAVARLKKMRDGFKDHFPVDDEAMAQRGVGYGERRRLHRLADESEKDYTALAMAIEAMESGTQVGE